MVGRGIPESLAELLKKIRTEIFQVNKTEMAAMLDAVARDPIVTPKMKRGDEINKIEERERNLLFENIESYSRLLGIPTCALSFVSRYQRTSLDEAHVVAVAMLQLIKDARRDGRNRLSVIDLHRIAHMINLTDVAHRPPLPPLDDVSKPPSEIDAASHRRHRRGEDGVETTPLFGARLSDNTDDDTP